MGSENGQLSLSWLRLRRYRSVDGHLGVSTMRKQHRGWSVHERTGARGCGAGSARNSDICLLPGKQSRTRGEALLAGGMVSWPRVEKSARKTGRGVTSAGGGFAVCGSAGVSSRSRAVFPSLNVTWHLNVLACDLLDKQTGTDTVSADGLKS